MVDLTPGSSDRTGRVTRRGVLRTGAIAATAVFAGCSGAGGGDNGDGTDPTTAGSPSTPSTETPAETEAPEETETAEETQTPVSPPVGADVLGGPDDLQSSAEVRATVLEEDQGAGRYVFTPAVVWLEPGGTIFWTFEETDHTVTVYHPQYDKPKRIPDAAETPFNSEFTGGGEPGTSFNFVFNVEGVWNYFCKPHEERGMVGMVIVGSPQGGDGAAAPTVVKSAGASEKLTRLLEVAEIGNSTETESSSDIVEIPRYEFSEGESYTFDTLFRTDSGTRESTETWTVTAVDGEDVTVEVSSTVDGETTTQTFSGTHETIYDVAAQELVFNAFAVARSPLRFAEMGNLSAGNN
ncbi:cupredoxin domain-containing protein, partial [Halodesulfurarchaeum sp.]|uniref:cupredoxin domain-containing protein n=1 Tax=Halodesulfurarchaeum sp. TaxID=1980530 RepID=UPI002FC35E63